MSVNGEHDIEGLKCIGAVVAAARDAMATHVVPGVTTAELDANGKEHLDRYGARSAPQLAYGFPGVTCISVNDQLAHGIPSPERVLRAGDLVNIDVSAELDGYWVREFRRRGTRCSGSLGARSSAITALGPKTVAGCRPLQNRAVLRTGFARAQFS
jgi:methionyl aminopeptidase